jgi:hypothetical protein
VYPTPPAAVTRNITDAQIKSTLDNTSARFINSYAGNYQSVTGLKRRSASSQREYSAPRFECRYIAATGAVMRCSTIAGEAGADSQSTGFFIVSDEHVVLMPEARRRLVHPNVRGKGGILAYKGIRRMRSIRRDFIGIGVICMFTDKRLLAPTEAKFLSTTNAPLVFFRASPRGDDSAFRRIYQKTRTSLHALKYTTTRLRYVEAGDGDELWEYSIHRLRLAQAEHF